MSEDLSTTFNEVSYAQLLNQVKSRIREARVRAGLAANRELVALYWGVGKLIVERQRAKGWGSAVIERLSQDVRTNLLNLTGTKTTSITLPYME